MAAVLTSALCNIVVQGNKLNVAKSLEMQTFGCLLNWKPINVHNLHTGLWVQFAALLQFREAQY